MPCETLSVLISTTESLTVFEICWTVILLLVADARSKDSLEPVCVEPDCELALGVPVFWPAASMLPAYPPPPARRSTARSRHASFVFVHSMTFGCFVFFGRDLRGPLLISELTLCPLYGPLLCPPSDPLLKELLLPLSVCPLPDGDV
jgi:hypothetical protein